MKTIPEQLEEALRENAALRASGSNAETAAKIAELSKQANTAKEELVSATARISDLEQQLATTKANLETAFKRGHEEAMAGLKVEIEKKAVLKACQIARSVGQPYDPSSAREEPVQKTELTPERAQEIVAARYRAMGIK